MSKEIEKAEDLARRMYPHDMGGISTMARHVSTPSIRARDAQIVAWCIDQAVAADHEAESHEQMVTGEHGRIVSDTSRRQRAVFCEGQASAFRALAVKLGGGA